MLVIGIIYRIINLIDGRSYVGQTTGTENDRLYDHRYNAKNKLKCSPYLENAINKYGEKNFIITIIDFAISFEELNEKEYMWIEFFRTRNKKYGFNLKEGGKQGRVTEESRKKMSESMKYFYKTEKGIKHRENLSLMNSGENHPQYGTKLSIKTKNKISDTQFKNSKYYSTKVIQLDSGKNIIKEWDNIYELKKIGYDIYKIIRSVKQNNRYKTSQGYIWKFKELD